MKIVFAKRFRKQYQSAPEQVKRDFNERLEIFAEDRQAATLGNHALKGKLKGYRSINVTEDWRAIFREAKTGNHIIFVLLGKHSELYG
ncbi:MAG: type II toxin-antitoxin system mRNA interferase toxin, RelE/StbE family [Candidatus Pacebacteria bacterium]|nr:type II toxin-antitoxin system mRNA interferase toxin, RelE/StbE family [Candidatus Paceibacterota bacterium]